jgi:hypothetical protein
MQTKWFSILRFLSISTFIVIPVQIFSQEQIAASSVITFDEIWNKTQNVSPGQKEAALEKQVARIASDRSERHWLPRAFAEYRYFLTNDPGTVLMSNMGQREVTQNDFSPATLNHPGIVRAGKGTIGIDLPLYEGGGRIAESQALAKVSEGKVYAEKYIRKYEFGTSAVSYGSIASLKKKHERLNELHDKVQLLLAGYRDDFKSNPVEYSGILGLKALHNRLKALLDDNESRIQSEKFFLKKITGNSFPENWETQYVDILVFSERYFSIENVSEDGESYHIKEYRAYADSAQEKAKGQKSVYLPTLGLFSNADIYNGQHSLDHSYTAGFYVRMNIFTPTEYGSVKQAQTESEAVKAKTENARLQEQVEREKLYRMNGTLRKNIALLRDSLVIINEQTANSFRLFSNGSIKALQLVEVLSRKTDLIENLCEAEEGYLSNVSGLYILSSSDMEIKNEK